MPAAIVTDIEGTTSSIAFVHEVLFPYARDRLADFVAAHCEARAVREQLDAVKSELGIGADDAAAVRALRDWIAEDRKATPLKALQGLIWEAGYAAGDFHGHVYADAERNLRRWHDRGIALYVYSSGSVHAQQLLFGHTAWGDLNPLFRGYYDTLIGPKRTSSSYAAIVAQIGLPADDILFLSDVEAELDAARSAGLDTLQLVRDGAVETGAHRQAADFDEVSRIIGV